MRRLKIIWVKNVLLLGIISAFFVILVSNLGFVKVSTDVLEAVTLDKRYKLRGNLIGSAAQHQKKASQIVVIAIDEKSLKDLGRFQDWQRSYYASLIDTLKKCGVASIGFDIILSEPSKEAKQDSFLIRSTKRSEITFHSLHLSKYQANIIPAEVFQKLLLLFILFFSGFSAYSLAKKLTNSEVGSFYAGILYMINPYT